MRASEKAWLGLTAGVIAYEVLCPEGEFLTDQMDRWRETAIGKLATTALVWSVAGHLTRTIPPQYDWIHRLSDLKSIDK